MWTSTNNPQEWLKWRLFEWYQYSHKDEVELIEGWEDIKFEQPGELVVDNFPNLWKTRGFRVYNLTKLTISNCPKLEKIDIVYYENLQELILHNLPNLKELDCSTTQLVTLDLSNCPNLERIYCQDNHLIEIKLPKGEKLEILYLRDNNFNQGLSFLRNLVNLKDLDLGNSEQEKIQKDIYNRFYGSLEPLKNLTKLKSLDIRDTDIDSGLEYLPESVEIFYCSVKEKKNAKCQVIRDLFANEKGIVEIEDCGEIENFPQKLQEIKQKWETENPQKALQLQKERNEFLKSSCETYKKDLKKQARELKSQTKYQNLLEQKIQDLENQLITTAKQKISQKKDLNQKETENNHLKSQLNKTEELLTEQTAQIIHNPPK